MSFQKGSDWTAGTTAGKLVSANGHRSKVILQNIGEERVFLSFGDGPHDPTPEVAKGLFIPAGGHVVIDDPSLVAYAVMGITETGECTGTYQEA